MKRINILLSLLSLNVILISVERFSPTVKILLQPYSFFRLHEVVQMLVLTSFSVIVFFLIFKELSNNFELIKKKYGVFLGILFILGVYFYSTGNGVHETGSFLFNHFCPKNNLESFCGSTYFEDYYFGNIIYFIGLFLMLVPSLFFERWNNSKKFNSKGLFILIVNGLISALSFFAYIAFDPSPVGLIFVIIFALFSDAMFFIQKSHWRAIPYTFYNAFGFSLASISGIFVRFFLR